jgi:putative ABC transport system permease protein
MFFLTYLRRELRRRMRQAVFIAVGLALGIGLVITVSAASAGVRDAQASVLHALYGVGTDVTITKPPPPFNPAAGGGTRIQVGPGGAFINGKPAAGQTVDNLSGAGYGVLPYSSVATVSRLHGVAAAAGALTLTDNKLTFPKSASSGPGLELPDSASLGVTGVDIAHGTLGPFGNASLTSGRALASSDASSDVAVVDSGYAAANKLKVGSTITIAKTNFKVVGIVSQPQGGNPADAYIPLSRAQALGTAGGSSLKNEVNTIYVTAASAADVPTVQREIHGALPSATVTTASSLANEVTGSLKNTAALAEDLGKWLAVVVLIVAFGVASLLTMAAVSRRVREFGTLKALGWRSRRIIAQVMGESLVIGIVGGLAGVALGFGGALLISKIAPELYATVGQSGGPGPTTGAQNANGVIRRIGPDTVHTVAVALTAPVTVGAVLLAVVLALAGGLIAGSFGGWRAARLRPAAALAHV